MPLSTDLHTVDGGVTPALHAAASPPAGAVSATPSGHPRQGPDATLAAQLPRTPRPSGTVAGPALLVIVALAVFALVMAMVTGPGAGGADHQHGGHAGPIATDYVPLEALPAARRGSPMVRTTSTTTSATPRPTAPRPTSPSPPRPRPASGVTSRSTSGLCCGTSATPARTPTAQEAVGTAISATSSPRPRSPWTSSATCRRR